MKHNLYKIIAVVSVLLGALGPQVASGQFNLAQTTLTQVGLESPTFSISIVSQPSSTKTIENKVILDHSCATNLDSSRPDLLLWQGCDNLAFAPTLAQPIIAVVSQPNNLPQLAVQSPISFNPKLSFNSTSNQEVSLIPLLGFAFPNNDFSEGNRDNSNSRIVSVTLSSNQQNYIRTIIFKC